LFTINSFDRGAVHGWENFSNPELLSREPEDQVETGQKHRNNNQECNELVYYSLPPCHLTIFPNDVSGLGCRGEFSLTERLVRQNFELFHTFEGNESRNWDFKVTIIVIMHNIKDLLLFMSELVKLLCGNQLTPLAHHIN
jgi:hypothetical protein